MALTLGLTIVLVVNENQEMCALWQREIDMYPLMSCPGYAHNGTQAVVMAREVEPNVVVMPLTLPDAQASEIARQMLAAQDDLLIVMYSPDASERPMALEAGAVEHFALPIETDRLTELIRTVRKMHGG